MSKLPDHRCFVEDKKKERELLTSNKFGNNVLNEVKQVSLWQDLSKLLLC